MPLDLWFALVAYVMVTSVTPGPNNTMLLASGVNHGVRRSWPHLIGVNLGFGGLLLGVGLGLGAVFTQLPMLHTVLKIGGAAYLLWLAWRIAHAPPPGAVGDRPRVTFVEAAAFQWLNPKAWIMALGAVSTYLPPESFWTALGIAIATFCVFGLPCSFVWLAAGSALRRALTDRRALRVFNIAMALALVASVGIVLL